MTLTSQEWLRLRHVVAIAHQKKYALGDNSSSIASVSPPRRKRGQSKQRRKSSTSRGRPSKINSSTRLSYGGVAAKGMFGRDRQRVYGDYTDEEETVVLARLKQGHSY